MKLVKLPFPINQVFIFPHIMEKINGRLLQFIFAGASPETTGPAKSPALYKNAIDGK